MGEVVHETPYHPWSSASGRASLADRGDGSPEYPSAPSSSMPSHSVSRPSSASAAHSRAPVSIPSNPYQPSRTTLESQRTAPPPQETAPPGVPASTQRPLHGSPQVATAPESASNMTPTQSSTPPKLKVKDLQHIQSFNDTDLDLMANSRPPRHCSLDNPANLPPQYEISDMPVADVIEMVAGLLTKITSTNDEQHEHLHKQLPTAESAMGLSQQTASVLAFHGKNVPNITIMSYLTRIHKYCPATFEVFLSLLVYFDRMTEKVNAGPLQNLRQQSGDQTSDESSSKKSGDFSDKDTSTSSGLPSPPLSDSDPSHLQHFFVVDSFNIHRLVIAGVTCASKFFSDIFYTNSRYAKVGGLPLAELNHLELQFLLLNDFRLSITTEELEAYATMLVEFYAREIVAQRRDEATTAAEAAP